MSALVRGPQAAGSGLVPCAGVPFQVAPVEALGVEELFEGDAEGGDNVPPPALGADDWVSEPEELFETAELPVLAVVFALAGTSIAATPNTAAVPTTAMAAIQRVVRRTRLIALSLRCAASRRWVDGSVVMVSRCQVDTMIPPVAKSPSKAT